MKNFTKTILSVGLYAIALTPAVALANDYWQTLPLEVRNYMNYEHREPCQHYKVMPEAMKPYDRCGNAEKKNKVVVQSDEVVLLPVVASYTVYFDFDKHNIRDDQMVTLQQLAADMNKYQPAQVTVVGHTDAAGSAEYNQALSAKRADEVSRYLTAHNISNFFLDEQAAGEYDPAVPTPDGTRLAENRRVVIQFRK